ncbi:MAG: hypothetical protein N3D84_00955 [Candidatus Woesearchaeota archaeon]|nr:hypothetical protein [Candidatus Woesearchaeota archaeon]
MEIKGVKAVCRNCGRYVNTNDLILDPVFKMMVCKECVKDRKMRESVHKEAREMRLQKKQQGIIQEEKPAGWDYDDEVIEKAYKMKMKTSVKVEKVGNKVKYSCPKCKYTFLYDPEKKKPARCPYCASDIRSIRF